MSEGYNEVYIEVTNKEAPFKKHKTVLLTGQSFDKELITVKRKGKIQNMYDWTQSRAGENDYYQVLEKYHGDDSAAKAELIKNAQDIGDQLRAINSMEDIFEAEKASQLAWDQLPFSVRQEFGQNRALWQKNGEKWLMNKYNELQAMIAQENEPINEPQEENN